jgi:tetratricopeptide (TPR) repeat protein
MLLALGSDVVAAGQNPEAVRILSQLVGRYPDEGEAYLKLAEAYQKSGDAVRATATLRQLALRQPAYPMIHISLAQAMLAEDPVDRPGVLRELAESEKLTPQDFDVFYLRGKVLALMSQYKEAEIALRRAVDAPPHRAGPPLSARPRVSQIRTGSSRQAGIRSGGTPEAVRRPVTESCTTSIDRPLAISCMPGACHSSFPKNSKGEKPARKADRCSRF